MGFFLGFKILSDALAVFHFPRTVAKHGKGASRRCDVWDPIQQMLPQVLVSLSDGPPRRTILLPLSYIKDVRRMLQPPPLPIYWSGTLLTLFLFFHNNSSHLTQLHVTISDIVTIIYGSIAPLG